MANYTGLPTVYNDENIHGYMINDSMQSIVENVIIVKSGNNPPIIKAGSSFMVYNTDTATILNTATTGNDVYPEGSTSVEYYKPYAVFQSDDTALAWGSGIVPAQSDGVWYIVCLTSAITEADKGNGVYSLSKTEVPVWSETKKGYYSTSGYKVIGRFVSTSSVISALSVFTGMTKDRGYISDIAMTVDGSNDLVIGKLNADIDGKIVQQLEAVTVGTWSASTWYAITISEVTGAITNTAISGFDNWTISGNQLNAYSIYDGEYGYCRDSISSVFHRVIGVAFRNSGDNGFDYIIPIKNIPFSYIDVGINGYNITNTTTVIDFDLITVDLNSEVDTTTASAEGRYVPAFSQSISGSCQLRIDANVWSASALGILALGKNGTTAIANIDAFQIGVVTASIITWLKGAIFENVTEGDYYVITGYQNDTASIACDTTASNTYWKIRGSK